jgi:hypothetical protein
MESAPSFLLLIALISDTALAELQAGREKFSIIEASEQAIGKKKLSTKREIFIRRFESIEQNGTECNRRRNDL